MTGLPEGIPLFRPEVVERRANVLYGSTLLPQSGLLRRLTWLAVSLTCGVFAALACATHTPRTSATGRLVYHPAHATVASPRAGSIGRVFRGDGAEVEQGDPLIEILSGRSSAETPSIEHQLVEGLRKEAEGLAGQIDTEEALLASELRTAQYEIRVAEQNRSHLAELRSLAMRKVSLAEAAVARTADLARRRLIPDSTHDTATAEVLAARMAITDIEHRLGQASAELVAKQARAQALPLLARQRIAELRRQILAVEDRLTQIDGERTSVLRAPFPGRVTRLLAATGQSVGPGTELLTIIPRNAHLQAELMIPARAAGFVQPGLPVRIGYDAFPPAQFGYFTGTVTAVDGATTRAGTPATEPAYRATVAIPSQSIRTEEQPVELRSGMTFRADILQRPRRLLDWIIDPLRSRSAA